MKKILCVMILLCTNSVYADSMAELEIRSIYRNNERFEYDIETKNYQSACSHSKQLEIGLSNLGSLSTGEFREEIKEQGIKQHTITEYVCSIE